MLYEVNVLLTIYQSAKEVEVAALELWCDKKVKIESYTEFLWFNNILSNSCIVNLHPS